MTYKHIGNTGNTAQIQQIHKRDTTERAQKQKKNTLGELLLPPFPHFSIAPPRLYGIIECDILYPIPILINLISNYFKLIAN
jgi:hypothetical protein